MVRTLILSIQSTLGVCFVGEFMICVCNLSSTGFMAYIKKDLKLVIVHWLSLVKLVKLVTPLDCDAM